MSHTRPGNKPEIAQGVDDRDVPVQRVPFLPNVPLSAICFFLKSSKSNICIKFNSIISNP
jgi:hypothetical protein